jgi:hypothetical protein
MRKSKNGYNQAARYQGIADASRTTGLSQSYLRNGCRDGTIPHIRCGRVYMIDVPGLYDALNTFHCHACGAHGDVIELFAGDKK